MAVRTAKVGVRGALRALSAATGAYKPTEIL